MSNVTADSTGEEPYDPNPLVRPDYFIINGVLGICAVSVCVALRLYTRRFLLQRLAIDDWLVVAAWCAVFAHAGMFIAFGGIHIATAPDEWSMLLFDHASNVLWFQNFIYAIAQILVKVALAAFFAAILSSADTKRQRRVLIWSTGIFSLFTITYAFVNLFQCGDPLLFLRQPDAMPTCLPVEPLKVVGIVSAVVNAVMDWLLMLLPSTLIWQNLMSSRMKVSAALVLLLGISGSLISIARIPVIAHSSWDEGDEGFYKLWKFFFLAFWENAVGLMAVSLAATRPLMRRALGESEDDRDRPEPRLPTIRFEEDSSGSKSEEKKGSLVVATTYRVGA